MNPETQNHPPIRLVLSYTGLLSALVYRTVTPDDLTPDTLYYFGCSRESAMDPHYGTAYTGRAQDLVSAKADIEHVLHFAEIQGRVGYQKGELYNHPPGPLATLLSGRPGKSSYPEMRDRVFLRAPGSVVLWNGDGFVAQ